MIGLLEINYVVLQISDYKKKWHLICYDLVFLSTRAKKIWSDDWNANPLILNSINFHKDRE